jgi:3-hydroxyisobutyrate dehydrogenase-like beta-hydroxyacid dehydrogenase
MNIGWIGLGEIGTGMALRAVAAGHALKAYARGAGQDELAGQGGTLVSSYQEVAEGCDLLCLCVFKDEQVRRILLDDGLLATLRPGAVVAIHTTGAPAFAQSLGHAAPEGVEVLDATFSGDPRKAREGMLTLMVGGDAAALEKARPVLQSYASHIHHVGPLGAGQTLKLLNNLLFAANLRLAGDTLAIARQQGFAPGVVADIVQQCSGMSLAMGLFKGHDDVSAVLEAARPYLEKDVSTALEAAADSGLDLGTLAKVTGEVWSVC